MTINPSLVRALIEKYLVEDSDLNAFCIDHFPDVYRRFASGMDRVGKVNLLLSVRAPVEIAEALGAIYPQVEVQSQAGNGSGSESDQLERTVTRSQSGGSPAPSPSVTAAWHSAEQAKGKVDIGIVTIREDEFEAVLDRFPKAGRVSGRRQYNLRRLPLSDGASYLVAVIRCVEQGSGEAQAAAHDLLEELQPQWLLVVGIAGGVPSDEFGLGDVVVSTRIVDFSVEAVLQDRGTEYALAGGPLHEQASTLAANLSALKEELGQWNTPASIGLSRPPAECTDDSLYGDAEWQKKVRRTIARHAARTAPLVTAGVIAASDRLIKDTEIVSVWLKVARQLLAIEMESAGVYRATFARQIPLLSIRGISDVIGFKRDTGWTKYACQTAAAFAYAFLQTRPVPRRIISHDLVPPPQVPAQSVQVRIYNLQSELDWILSVEPGATLLQLASEFRAQLAVRAWPSRSTAKPSSRHQFRFYRSETDNTPLSPHTTLAELLRERQPLALNVECYRAFRDSPTKGFR